MIEAWFPTAIYSAVIDYSDMQDLINTAYAIRESNPSDHQWNCDTYSSIGYDLNNDLRLISVASIIKEHVVEFAKEHGVLGSECYLKEGWFNISSTGNYQEYHVHQNCHFSSVFYLKTPPDCGNIVFKNPTADIDMCKPPLHQVTQFNFETASYEASVGKLLIFRSFVQHMVLKNRSNEDRISLAMNWNFQN
jgi:uncharacterized protein (TIGR02466 family)